MDDATLRYFVNRASEEDRKAREAGSVEAAAIHKAMAEEYRNRAQRLAGDD